MAVSHNHRGRNYMRKKQQRMEYGRTGMTGEQLAKQCAIRLLRGDSWLAVESSLKARGVEPTDDIMAMAEEMALSERT